MTLRVLALAVLLGLTACAPSVSPLYRDYERPSERQPPSLELVRQALGEAGCELAVLKGPAHWSSEDAFAMIRAALGRGEG